MMVDGNVVTWVLLGTILPFKSTRLMEISAQLNEEFLEVNQEKKKCMKSQHSSLSKMMPRLHETYEIHGRVGMWGATKKFSNWHYYPLFK